MKKYQIIISEPWGFRAEDGTNKITGVIVQEFPNGELLFRTDKPIEFNDVVSDAFILHNRLFNHEPILNSGGIVNGGIIQNYTENLNQKEINDQEIFVFIGNIKEVGS